MRPHQAYGLWKYANETAPSQSSNLPVLSKRAPLPYSVDHPYLHAMTNAGIGTILGATVGGLSGHGLGKLFKKVDGAGLAGALGGAYLGGALGGAAGTGMAAYEHFKDRDAYSTAERAAGRTGDLPLTVRHPYIANAALLGLAPLAHYYEKTRLPDAE